MLITSWKQGVRIIIAITGLPMILIGILVALTATPQVDHNAQLNNAVVISAHYEGWIEVYTYMRSNGIALRLPERSYNVVNLGVVEGDTIYLQGGCARITDGFDEGLTMRYEKIDYVGCRVQNHVKDMPLYQYTINTFILTDRYYEQGSSSEIGARFNFPDMSHMPIEYNRCPISSDRYSDRQADEAYLGCQRTVRQRAYSVLIQFDHGLHECSLIPTLLDEIEFVGRHVTGTYDETEGINCETIKPV